MKLNYSRIAQPLFLFLFLFLLLNSGCRKSSTDTLVQGTTVIPDPPQYETPFADVPATSDIIMYEINERAFSTSGNFAGIMPRLDSIRDLGVNVIWLMPIFPIGVLNGINSPYCVKSYKEVNPEYGSLEDLRTLIREAHARKMAVILDWVANHTSWDNSWITNTSWYTQDGNGNIVSPPGTGWLDVADLNYDNNDMRLEMIRCMKYWLLAANADGFRCDAADYVPYSFWKQAMDSIKKIPNRDLILLAEGARSDHFAAGFQMNFSWDFFPALKSVFKNNQPAGNIYLAHQQEYVSMPAGDHKLRFTSNHDVDAWDDTPLGLFGGKSGSMSAFVITAFMGGVPLIYDGQEVGCTVKLPFFSRSPINWTTNPDMILEYKRLLQLRTSHTALRTGSLELYDNNNIVAFKRQSGADEVLVFANTRNAAKTFPVPLSIQNTTWTDAYSGMPVTLDSVVNLASYEYVVLLK
jgi:glycosidase